MRQYIQTLAVISNIGKAKATPPPKFFLYLFSFLPPFSYQKFDTVNQIKQCFAKQAAIPPY